jgi:hypothetical protein
MKIKHLLHKNPIYTNTYETMMAYQQAYLANGVFKQSVRKKRPSEDSLLYTDMIQNTAVQPIARYVIDTINDVVFEPGIDRTIQFMSEVGTQLPYERGDWAELFQLDADLTNTSLLGVMENIGDLTSIYGHCWVFVDMPEAELNNSNSKKQPRPYVIPVSPLNVWDWDFRTVRGVQLPEYVKVVEKETIDEIYFKIYYLGNSQQASYWEAYEIDKADDPSTDVQPYATGQFPMGMSIPGFIAYTKRDPRCFELGISDIDLAADAQREIYKLECEAYSSIQFARTILRADQGIKIGALSGSIVRAQQGQVEAISISQQDVVAIIEKQDSILRNFLEMSGFGGMIKGSKQIQSGVSIVEERRQLHRIAKAKARLMEVTEEQIWTFAARFMGIRWAGEVKYSMDFEAYDTTYRMALIEKAKALLPENPLINGLIFKELVAMLATPQEQQEYMDAAVTLADPTMRMLEREEQREAYSRDIYDTLPAGDYGGEDEDPKSDMMGEAEGTEASTMIRNTGVSMNTSDAIATQILAGMVNGR